MNIRGEFTSSPADARSPSKLRRARLGHLAIAFAIPGIVIVGVIARGGKEAEALTWQYTVACAGGAAALVYLGLEWNLQRILRSAKEEYFQFAFTDDGIEIRSEKAETKMSWDLINKATLDDEGVVLFWPDGSPFFIPARGFANGYPRAELREFLRSKLRSSST